MEVSTGKSFGLKVLTLGLLCMGLAAVPWHTAKTDKMNENCLSEEEARCTLSLEE